MGTIRQHLQKAIRRATRRLVPKSERRCYITNQKRVQQHHIIEVCRTADFMQNNPEVPVTDIGEGKNFNPVSVDLCEREHKISHVVNGDRTANIILNEKQVEAQKDFAAMAEAQMIFDNAINPTTHKPYNQEVIHEWNGLCRMTANEILDGVENYSYETYFAAKDEIGVEA